MGVGLSRPDVWFGLGMNADPNDPMTRPVWSDWTNKLRRVSNLERGRNFELDQGMAAEPELLIRDVDELLNPANPTSPYAGLILPYRQACLLAQYPAAPAGGNVNLFNTSTWKGNTEDVRDGSFESLTTGTRPTWVGAIGGTSPLVSTSFPFQGSKSMRFPVVAGAAWQGMSWPVACIPGRQYTCSAYVLQDAANTQRISVTDQVLVADPFDGRTVSGGLGAAYFGGTYTIAGGVAGNYAVSGGTAQITNASVNVIREAVLSVGTPDVRVFGRVTVPVVPTGAPITAWLMGRRTDGNNMYLAQAQCNTDTTVTVALIKRVAGVQTTIGSVVLPDPHTPGAEWNLLLECRRGLQFVYAWKTGKPAPTSELDAVLTATDTALTTGNDVAFMNRLETGSGDTNVVTSWSYFGATGYVHGGTTAATGSYQRLSVTFTATQTQHVIQLATSGTALNSTINIDAVQHEQAAAASAYVTTGPVIYPIFRNYVEHWPRVWGSAGFEGHVQAPCVDAFAALNATAITGEYAQAVLASSPTYYWRLNDGTDTTQFADTSGNGGPSLFFQSSKFGAGTIPQAGAQLPLPGDPGGTGVDWTPRSTTSPNGTLLTAGTFGGGSGISVPAQPGIAWAASAAVWARLADDTTGDQSVFRFNGRAIRFVMNVKQAPSLGAVAALNTPLSSCTATGAASNAMDGNAHLFIGTVSQDATNTTVEVWMDGVLLATSTVSTATLGGLPTSTANTIQVGGVMFDYPFSSYGAFANGVIDNVALWNRVLSSGEITDLYLAGSVGFNGETTGARTDRHLDLGGYTGPRRISQSTGQTPLQAPSWSGLRDLLTDSQENTVAEQGTLWVAPDGAVVFESRQDRWLRLNPVLTIGENTAGGEVPYLMDGLRFDLDSLYVFADVQISRNNGATAVGGGQADIATARRRFFGRSVQAAADFYTDAYAQSAANWIFNSHDYPMLRVDAIVIDPASNPTLWPVALGLEVGQRVTVKRRAKAANSGAGITMSADYFVEKVAMPMIDFDSGEWTVQIQLSPINAAPPAGQPTMQPWILGDATYGVLNATTVLGW